LSRAFVKEQEGTAPPPERMVPEGPNLVTPSGLAQIEAHVARIERALKTETQFLLRETLERDLRYWAVRRASAEVVPPQNGDKVAFGAKVTFRRNGRDQSMRIVGMDEADPKQGLINFQAPLARALLGAEVGDVIEMENAKGEIEVLAVK